MIFNINHEVRVRLTNRGKDVRTKYYLKYLQCFEEPKLEEDSDGWSKWQLWFLMSVFGPYLCNGCPLCFETEIEIPDRIESPKPKGLER